MKFHVEEGKVIFEDGSSREASVNAIERLMRHSYVENDSLAVNATVLRLWLATAHLDFEPPKRRRTNT